MKILIGRPGPATEGYKPYPNSAFLYPHEIRAEIKMMLANEEDEDWGEEHQIVTLNRTVLDEVAFSGHPLSYADVSVLVEGQIVPLLDLHHDAWLSHFALGDLFDRGKLTGTGAPKENA